MDYECCIVTILADPYLLSGSIQSHVISSNTSAMHMPSRAAHFTTNEAPRTNWHSAPPDANAQDVVPKTRDQTNPYELAVYGETLRNRRRGAARAPSFLLILIRRNNQKSIAVPSRITMHHRIVSHLPIFIRTTLSGRRLILIIGSTLSEWLNIIATLSGLKG